VRRQQYRSQNPLEESLIDATLSDLRPRFGANGRVEARVLNRLAERRFLAYFTARDDLDYEMTFIRSK
jgi:hypothetical protein